MKTDVYEEKPKAQSQSKSNYKGSGDKEEIMKKVEAAGKDFFKELNDLYVSPVIAKALLAVDAEFATDEKKAKEALRAQFRGRASWRS